MASFQLAQPHSECELTIAIATKNVNCLTLEDEFVGSLTAAYILSFAWARSKKNCTLFIATASVLYRKYSTVVGKYSTVGSQEVSRI